MLTQRGTKLYKKINDHRILLGLCSEQYFHNYKNINTDSNSSKDCDINIKIRGEDKWDV